jgi:hypothetical protein
MTKHLDTSCAYEGFPGEDPPEQINIDAAAIAPLAGEPARRRPFASQNRFLSNECEIAVRRRGR